MEASSPQIVWLSTLPRRFGIILEKILDRHERSGIAVQWNGGVLSVNSTLCMLGNFSCVSTSVKCFQNYLFSKNYFRNTNIVGSKLFAKDDTSKQRGKVGVVFGKVN